MTKRTRTTAAIAPRPALTRMASLPGGFGQEQATYQLLNWFNQLPDPDETLSKLGFKRQDLRKLETDDEVYQCLEKRREALLATPWRLEPGNSRAARFIIDEITPHLPHLMMSAFMAVPYGYSVCEVVYRKQPNGRVGIASLSEKPFEWFIPTPSGDLRYFPEDGRGGAEGLECHPYKYLLTRNKSTYRNPYGEALFSRLYWPVFFRSQGWRFWAQFLERFGTPMLLGKTMGDADALATALAGAVSDAVIVAGNGDEISAVESGKDGQQFKLFEEAILSRIQKSILGQTLSSDAKATGMGSGVADLHKQVLEEKRRSDARLITATVQRLIDALSHFNGFQSPQFVLADDSGLERDRAERDEILVKNGIIELTEDYLLDRYDFKPGDFKMPVKPALTAPGQTIDGESTQVDDMEEVANAKAHLITMARKKIEFTPQQQAIEDSADALMLQVPEPINIESMLSAVKAATDPADLAVRLSMLLDQRDPRFTELLARAQFAAQTLGYVVAEQEAPQPKTQALEAIFQPQPQPINLHITAPITMAGAEPTVINVTNQVQPTPLNVSVAAPNVAITNEVQPASVELSMPLRKTTTEIERDANGDISRTTQTETDQ